jgi:chemotaxis protein MotA
MRESSGRLTVAGLVCGAVVVVWAHTSMGGDLRLFLQPEALIVVFGGTLAALMVSFPGTALRNAVAGVADLLRRRPMPLEALVPAFITYARKARKHGLQAVERDIESAQDAFLSRALSLSVTGLPVQVVREALEIDARVLAEREEERAQVFEAAAGYAPTLGIVGAVLGLMRVMQHFSATDAIGTGIAAAFVATIFGVGAANLVFLPLATRLRARARQDMLRRELVIDGVMALRDGASPGVLEERLAGYLTLGRPASAWAEVA